MPTANIAKQGNDFLISGCLDFQTVVDLWSQSLPLMENESALHFDLAQVTSSNSAGMALMLEWVRYAYENHRAIDFKNIPAQLHSIISVSGIEKVLNRPF